MKRLSANFAAVLAAVAVLAILALFATPRVARAEDEVCRDPLRLDAYACRELVVEYGAGFDWLALGAKYGLRLVGVIPELQQAWFEAPRGTDMLWLLTQVAHEPGVVEAEPNGDFVSPECRQLNAGVIELGPNLYDLYRRQPGLETMHGVWDPSLGQGVVVAILDTGISHTQPELRASLMLPGIAFESCSTGYADDCGNGIDDDGDGIVDSGWGHGTAVAGLVHLVAPAARLLPVKVLDDECQGSAFSLAAGIVRAVNRGARVLNLSFGSLDGSGVVTAAIRWAQERGAIVVAPTGNSGIGELQFPADKEEAFSVAAVDDSLRATSFTNYDKDVDVSAPGVDLITVRRGSYWSVSGTSFSNALVSGAVAVAMQARPGLSGFAIENLVRAQVLPVDPFNPQLVGELGSGVPDLGQLRRMVQALPRRVPGPRPIVLGASPIGPAPGPGSLPGTGLPSAP